VRGIDILCGDNIDVLFVIYGDVCPYQESNLDLPLRRRPFYPLNYKDRSKSK